MAMLTKVSEDVHYHSIMQLMSGAIAAMSNARAEFESAKVATVSGRRITNLKTPTDVLHFQFN